MKSVIYIDKEGNISGLADDLIDNLVHLGPKQIERVSNIEFDHTSQEWVAVDMQGLKIASHKIRGEVIKAEREYLNRNIENSFSNQ